MLQELLNNKFRILQFVILLGCLVLIRAFENQLFYDPFLEYFKRDYAISPLPAYNPEKLFLGLLFRYALNSMLSLGIIYVLFKEADMVKFTAVLYVFFFLILIAAFFAVIYFYREHNNFLLFYVRRFLIQPIFVLLFVPAFYYQKQNS
jgi:exosortase F-associated protein